jgi:hypothetical protein
MLRGFKGFRYYIFGTMKKQLLSKGDCLGTLEELKIPFKLYEHEAVMNLE